MGLFSCFAPKARDKGGEKYVMDKGQKVDEAQQQKQQQQEKVKEAPPPAEEAKGKPEEAGDKDGGAPQLMHNPDASLIQNMLDPEGEQ